MKKRQQGVPHKSTTNEELYFHFHEAAQVGNRTFKGGTVFARRLGPDAPWMLTVARCSPNDNFCRQVGRSVARRRWFATNEVEPQKLMSLADAAEMLGCGFTGDKPSRADAYSVYAPAQG